MLVGKREKIEQMCVGQPTTQLFEFDTQYFTTVKLSHFSVLKLES